MTQVQIESYLSGRWQAGTGPGAVLVNPATEAPVASASTVGLDFGNALAFARTTGGAELRALTFAQRGAVLERMSGALHAAREGLIEAQLVNGGCTRGDAKFDVDGAIGVLSHYAELGKSLGDRRLLADGEGIQLGRSPRFWGQHVYVPRRGVAVLINAFNFPAWGFAEKAACALLAGMPVITKPATSTALTAYLATKVLVDAGLPPGILSFVGGGSGDLLDHLQGQDILSFTGSANTGHKLRSHRRVVEASVPVNVEADSLNAAVLGPDVELGSDTMQLFLRDLSREITQKTGQKCTAVRRIFVPAERVDDVVAELSARFSETVIGDPALKEVRMGPLASADQLRDVRAGVERLQKDATVVYGDPQAKLAPLGVEPGRGYFFPVLLLKAKNSAHSPEVHSHEVFGPVATVLPYSGKAEEAAELVALGGGGLVASIFSDDRDFTETATLGIAPFHGRVYLGSAKVLEHAMGPGLVLPQTIHGGPGRAGGGEELGGLRGVEHFMQRTAIQGSRPIVEHLTGTKPT
jgi:3,4-dehydroadipyl-CoA semialdehyde dehydrogenase